MKQAVDDLDLDLGSPSDEPPQNPVFQDILRALHEGRWTILLAALAGLAVGWFLLVSAEPKYRAAALIQVPPPQYATGNLSAGIIGNPSAEAGLPARAELEILRSRTLLGEVVQDLDLDVVAKPRRFPVLGNFYVGLHDSDIPAPARFGMDRYSWGGDSIEIGSFTVPVALLNQRFRLEVRGPAQYRLWRPGDSEPVLVGEVGLPAVSSSLPGVELFVRRLDARPGVEFTLFKADVDTIAMQLQSRLNVKDRGFLSGVIQVSMNGRSPEQVAAVVNSLTAHFIRRNVERRSDEAAKTLEFIESQIPALRESVEISENKLQSHRRQAGSVDLTAESSSLLNQTVELDNQLQGLELRRTELREKYKPNHPILITLDRKRAALASERDVLEAQLKKLPAAQQKAFRLQRDVTGANKLYLLMLDKAQELKIVKAGTVATAHVIDPALVPRSAYAPTSLLYLLGGLLLGTVLAIGILILLRLLRQGIEDPEQIEAITNIPVFASIPTSSEQQKIGKQIFGTKVNNTRSFRENLLTASTPDDMAVESLRSLRTALQFARLDRKNNIVAITGPSPNIGKSFVAANFSYLLGDSEHRVLLIDADMRRGTQHRYFAGTRTPGLSQVISGDVPLEDSIRDIEGTSLSYLPSGLAPPDAAKLLMTHQAQEIIDSLADRYDYVVIDTPPILAASEAAIVSRMAGVTFLVLRSGQHAEREITNSLKRLVHGGGHVDGIVLNNVQVRSGSQYGYGYIYQYVYK